MDVTFPSIESRTRIAQRSLPSLHRSAAPAGSIAALIDDGKSGGARFIYLEGDDLRVLTPSAYSTKYDDITAKRGEGRYQLPETSRVEKRAALHIKASLLSALIVGLLVRRISLRDQIKYRKEELWCDIRLLAIVAVLYFIEAALCSTHRYLANAYTPTEINDSVQSWIGAKPMVTWNVVCYHNRRHYHHYTDSQGRRRTRSDMKKVVTHRASRQYRITR